MKKYISIIASLFVSSFAFAQARQDTTTIYSNPGYNKDPMRSKWISSVEQKGDFWVLSLTDKKGVLREKISFADKKLEIRKGPYSFYENGVVKEEGNYEKGYKNGEWHYYYLNQQLIENVNYTYDKYNGAFKAYWDNGDLKKEGDYVMGIKTGNWKMFYKGKKLAANEEYDEKGKVVDGIYFDQEGNSVKNVFIIQPPSYPGGMQAFYQFLGREIRYPANAQKNNIQGTVKLEFTVMKDGKLEDVKVKESPDADLSSEALRVFRTSMNWLPAKELGEPVKMRYTIPIRFSLR